MCRRFLIVSYQFYINPVSYAWSALMENEFRRITVRVPRSPVVVSPLKFLYSLHVTVRILSHATPEMSPNIRTKVFFSMPGISLTFLCVSLAPT